MKKHADLIIFVSGLVLGLLIGTSTNSSLVSVAVGGRGGDYIAKQVVVKP